MYYYIIQLLPAQDMVLAEIYLAVYSKFNILRGGKSKKTSNFSGHVRQQATYHTVVFFF